MLEKLWEVQSEFQKHFYDASSLTKEEKVKWSKEFILSAVLELGEVMDTLKWKTYHSYKKECTIEDTKEELVDVMKFLINICIVNGITAEEFLHTFDEKTKTVQLRYKDYLEQNGK